MTAPVQPQRPRMPSLSGAEETELDIPAFLRRQPHGNTGLE
jgi:hypothetical protein